MNARARSLGLRQTRYADASGADPATVSTAADQFRLTVRAMQIPAFRQIVAMPQVTLPVAGLAYNVNAALGHDGITGVKTGSSSQAGGCLAFAAIRTAGGGQVTIVGVVLGVHATPAQPSELGGVISASENLLASIGTDLEHVQVIEPGAVLASVSSAWTAGPAAVAATGIAVTAWPGTPVTITVTPRPLGHAISAGPARRPGRGHGRQRGTPHHPGRQPGRVGTVGTLAAHPAVNGSGAPACRRARLAVGSRPTRGELIVRIPAPILWLGEPAGTKPISPCRAALHDSRDPGACHRSGEQLLAGRRRRLRHQAGDPLVIERCRAGILGQEGSADRGRDGHREDRGEAEVLASHDPGGRTAVPGALGEEQRQDHDVVDVGDGEQPGRRPDDARVHDWMVFSCGSTGLLLGRCRASVSRPPLPATLHRAHDDPEPEPDDDQIRDHLPGDHQPRRPPAAG